MVNLNYKVSVSVLAGSALAIFFSSTYHVGWVIREFELLDVSLLLVFTFLVPLVMIFVASINEKAKMLVLLANSLLFILSMYFVLINGVNYILPKDMKTELVVKVFYFNVLGSCISFMMISVRELLRLSRASRSWVLYLALSFVLSGLLTALVVSLGNNGWFIHVIISAMTLLSSLLYYLTASKKMILDQAKLYHQKRFLGEHVVQDRAKGIKIFFYALLTILNLALLLGVNGMALYEHDYSTINWHFYMVFIIGGPAGIFISKAFFGSIHVQLTSPVKEKRVQIGWLLILAFQVIASFIVFYLEVFVPGYHGSQIAQFIDGIAFSFVLSSFLMVIRLLHPPRKSQMFYMLIIYFLALGLAVGAALKGMAVLGNFTLELQVYFPYILYVNMGLVLVLCFMLVTTTFIRSFTSATTRKKLKSGEK